MATGFYALPQEDHKWKLTPEVGAALHEVTKGSNEFAWQLYKLLSAKHANNNVLLSPLSCQIVLAMAYIGSSGKTSQELRSVLQMPKDQTQVIEGYNALVRLTHRDPMFLLATKLYVDNKFCLKDEFKEILLKHFNTTNEKIDFRIETEEARRRINAWVEKTTDSKLKDLIPSGVLSSETVFIFINAIHFKARWKDCFPSRNTHPGDFYTFENERVDVDMMYMKEDFRYVEDHELGAKMLEIPYEGNAYAMYIILPEAIDGVPAVEEKLCQRNLSQVIQTMETCKVEVYLPKFELSQSVNIKELLKEAGVKYMFSEQKADFGGMSNQKIHVSEILQKSVMVLDERGTEAVSATGMMMANRAFVRLQKVEFKADHPFLFFIAATTNLSETEDDEFSNDFVILFMGKFYGRN